MNRRKFIMGAAVTAGAVALNPRVALAGHASGGYVPYGGLTTHMSYFGTPYGDLDTTVRALKALNTKLCRDGVAIDQGAGWYDRLYGAFRTIRQETGARFVMVSGPADQSVTAQLDVIAPLVADGLVAAIEGANEWDLNGGSDWQSELVAHQKELYRQVKARWPKMQVLGPSLFPSNCEKIGDLSAYMDMGNIHIYFATLPIDIYGMDRHIRLTKKMTGTKPLVATEANFIIGDGYPHGANSAGEKTQAEGMREMYRLLGERDVHRVMCYEPVNGSRPSSPSTNWQNNFGCFRSDWSTKPLAFEVRTANRRG